MSAGCGSPVSLERNSCDLPLINVVNVAEQRIACQRGGDPVSFLGFASLARRARQLSMAEDADAVSVEHGDPM
jgi:hypothetical protein